MARPRPHLARRMNGITGSLIDSSTALLERQQHDVVSFAMGSPAPTAIPRAAFARLGQVVLGANEVGAFDYAPTEGESAFRDVLRTELVARGLSVADGELMITSGGMQGLDLVCKLFVNPGDVVVTESPTYINAASTISSYEGSILEIPVDDDGMRVDVLESQVARSGLVPRMIYVIPTFQNPTGVTLSLERRLRLLELAELWGSLILEDDPYGWLRFAGSDVPTLWELGAGSGRVLTVQTFSKVLGPGLRLGWLLAPETLRDELIAARQGMDTCSNVPAQRLVRALLEEGGFDTHLAKLRADYQHRKTLMQDCLSEYFGGMDAQWTDPQGGFFLWLTLPGIDTTALFDHALAAGVAFIPGSAFSPSGHHRDAVRLCFSATDPERTRTGIRRLRDAVDAFRSLPSAL